MARLQRPDLSRDLREGWEEGVHRLPIQVRWRDTDGFGHVNNVVFASWIELARIAFLRGVDPPSGDLILARLELDFLRQVTLDAAVEVETRVSRVGRTSVGLRHLVLADGEPAARIESVVVLYDYARQAKRRVGPGLRAALLRYATEDAVDAAE
jgi:acyl-CoA thioester hydrolase